MSNRIVGLDGQPLSAAEARALVLPGRRWAAPPAPRVQVPLSPAVQALRGIGMTANAWAFYNNFHLWIADSTFNLASNTFKMALFTSTSNAATATNNLYGDLTNEVANANGYTTGGVTLTSVTWTISTATATFTAANAVWTASGGSITARYAVVYASGTLNGHASPLVASALLDNTPADVTATSGNTLTVQMNASGMFTLTG